MTPNKAATVPTEAATLHIIRSTAAPAYRPTAAVNSTATHASAETSIQSANSTSTWNAPPTPRNGLAKRDVKFHGRRPPRDTGAVEVAAFLTHLAAAARVAASTQNQVLQARSIAGYSVIHPLSLY